MEAINYIYSAISNKQMELISDKETAKKCDSVVTRAKVETDKVDWDEKDVEVTKKRRLIF